MPNLTDRPQIPTIDISPFLFPASPTKAAHIATPPTPAQTSTAHALAHACHHTGFFYLTNHSIPPALIARVLALARTFFLEASEADKRAIARPQAQGASANRSGRGKGGGDAARGYQRLGENVTGGRRDWHEAVDFYSESRSWSAYGSCAGWKDGGESNEEDEGGKDETLFRGRNLWPSHPAELRAVYEEYVSSLREVGTAIVRAMGLALTLDLDVGLEAGGKGSEMFVEATRDSFWVLRMIGYPSLDHNDEESGVGRPDDDKKEAYGCGAHTDYGCLTLLAMDGTRGALQVLSRFPSSSQPENEGSWLDVEPIEGAFVVNIGDMLERWTNGLWKSTLHRVVRPRNQARGHYRVSVPFFFEPDWDAVVEPLDGCVRRTGGERRYGPVRYGDHLTRKVTGNFA